MRRIITLHLIMEDNMSHKKTYQERYDDTCKLSDNELRALLKSREARGDECGVIYRVIADREDIRARYKR